MKIRFWLLFVIAAVALPVHAQHFQLGTVTRMQTKDCTILRGALATAVGYIPENNWEICPEYTVVSEKVVYVVVGKRSSQFMPLAEIIQFHLLKNELLVRVDDEKRESHFSIKEMQLRSDWERDQTIRGKQADLHLQADHNELRRQELTRVADEYNPR